MSSTYLLHDPHIETRHKLDIEIAELETRLVSLKLARNALAPITRLLPEILQEIFFQTHITSPHKGKATLLLTWISHTWRILAHDTSSLWSHIDFRNVEWVETALSRAKDRELEFSLDGRSRRINKRNLSPLVPYTLGNLSRIKKLSIVSRASSLFPPNPPEWLRPAPHLIDLRLHRLSLPPNVFSGVVPDLQSLHLASCTLDWETFPINRGLKTLVMSYPSQAPPINRLIGILQAISPTIDDLQLQHLFAQTYCRRPAGQIERIKLDNLKCLKLEEQNASDLAILLDQITLHPGLMVQEVSVTERHAEHLVSALIQARNIPRWPIHCLEVRAEDGHLTLRVVHKTMNKLDSQSHTQLSIGTPIEPSQFYSMLDSLPIQPIERVSFIGGYYIPQNTAKLGYIGSLGTVRELSIALPYLKTFIVSTEEQVNQAQSAVENDLNAGMEVDMDMDGPGAITDLNAARLALVQPLLSFHGLQELKIHSNSNPRTEYDVLTREDVTNLGKWLKWRYRLDLRLGELVVANLRVPSVDWMVQVFGELVDVFETRDLVEVEESAVL